MERIAGRVLGPDGGRPEAWDDPTRGRIRFRTVFSSEETATTGLTAGLAEMAPGGRLNVHRHEPAEVYHVLEGQGTVFLDGEVHPVRAGSAVFIPGSAWHGIRNTGDSALRFHYVLQADGMADVEYDFGEA
jgi:quercetin dioxygenase-like cupin family protein